jgi:hypothetical protein
MLKITILMSDKIHKFHETHQQPTDSKLKGIKSKIEKIFEPVLKVYPNDDIFVIWDDSSPIQMRYVSTTVPIEKISKILESDFTQHQS